MRELEETFVKLVRDNHARLRKLCRVYADDVEGEEDLYQDILVELWRPPPLLRRRFTASYLAVSRSAEHRAQPEAPAGGTPARDSGRVQPDLAEPIPAPDASLESNQRLRRLYAAINAR
jgi:DNA-directed RNA polymerase specialized sigma24 family protein